jgi:hypothetical protein
MRSLLSIGILAHTGVHLRAGHPWYHGYEGWQDGEKFEARSLDTNEGTDVFIARHSAANVRSVTAICN